MQSLIPAKLADILSSTAELSQAYLVGGCVRDWLLKKPVNDFDIEVFGVSYEGWRTRSQDSARSIWSDARLGFSN